VEVATIEQVLEQQFDFSQSPLEICGPSTTARSPSRLLEASTGVLESPARKTQWWGANQGHHGAGRSRLRGGYCRRLTSQCLAPPAA
jgi:hypothetical protein